MKLFKQYLLGREFLVRTDHAVLTWLQKTPEMMGQQARWQERLQEFSFQIQHRPGAKHGNADALSRRPCRRPGCCLPADDAEKVGTTTLNAFEANVLPAGKESAVRTMETDAVGRRELATSSVEKGRLNAMAES